MTHEQVQIVFEQIFDGLSMALSEAHLPWKPTSRENKWTETVFHCMEALADGRHVVNWRVKGAKERPPAGPGEWLFDLTWCDGNPRSGEFRGLVLALESEWGCGSRDGWPNKIHEDLNKLLVAACPLRVFVYSTPGFAPTQRDVPMALNLVRKTMSEVPGATSLNLLAVLVSPKTSATGSCTLQGLMYVGSGVPTPIEPRSC
ncbi:MAG TPA: hypothetical protein VMH22_11205 [bacterium]|nr:hypothetical protein [bacterium]